MSLRKNYYKLQKDASAFAKRMEQETSPTASVSVKTNLTDKLSMPNYEVEPKIRDFNDSENGDQCLHYMILILKKK